MGNYKGRRPGTRRIILWRNNRRHEWVVSGTKADGAAFEARKRIELEAHDHEIRSAPLLSQLCLDKYRPYAEANLTKATWRARKNILASFVVFFKGKTMARISAADIEAYKAWRMRESELQPVSMNTELRTLGIVYRWAQAQGYPVVIPTMKLLRQPRGRVKLWTEKQIAKLLEVARDRDPDVMRLVVFLVNTGCRKGEGLAAEWSWMDFEAGMVRIPANEVWKPKSGRAREVPMSDTVRTILAGPRTSERWVFPRGDGERYERFPDAIFKEIQTKAGVSGGAHVLRHSYASFFLRDRPDLPLLAQVLGHSTTRITELYAHFLPDHLSHARNVVNIGVPLATVAAPVGRAARRGERQRKNG